LAYKQTHDLVFLSHKNIIEEVLFCMMKHTLEEFILPYVNAVLSITTTFDLWINKGTLDNFAPMIIILNIGLGIEHVTIDLFEAKKLLELRLLVNCKLCLKSAN
jgi:hypothetical protein